MWHLNSTHGVGSSRRRASGRPRRHVYSLVAAATAGVLVLAGCGSSGGESASSESTGGNQSSSGTQTTSGNEGTGGGESAGGGGALADFKENGITVGIAGEPPYDFKNKQGEITGMSPSIGKHILHNLGITDITWKKVDFSGLIPGLNAGRFDMTMAAASITPKRAEQVAYTDPVYCVLEALGVKKGNPLNLSDYKSIANNPDAKLAVESGATELKYAKKVGIPDDQILQLSNPSALIAAVKTGRADAFSLTGITVRSLIEKSGEGKLEALKGFNPVINGEEKLSCGAPQFRKDEDALVEAYNQQLDKLQKAGKVYSTVKKASPEGDAFGFAKSQFVTAKKHTFKELAEG